MEKKINLDWDIFNPKDSLLKRVADNKGVRRRKRMKSFRQLIGYFIFISLMLLLFAFAGWKFYVYTITSSRFNIKIIKVEGTHFVSQDAVNSMLSKIRGRNIFLIELNQVQEILKENPWVQDCSIKRVLPDKLAIEVVEEKPAAILRSNKDLFFISWKGQILRKYNSERFDGLSLPLIANRSSLGLDSLKKELPIIMMAIREVKASYPQALNIIAEFDFLEKGMVCLRLKETFLEVKLGNKDFGQRIRNLMIIFPEVEKRLGYIDYIDLRFDHQVVIHQVKEGR